VQSSCLLKYFNAGPEVKVIGVSQNNPGLDILFQVPEMDALDRTDCPDRHKNGSFHDAVIRMKLTGSGFGVGGGMLQFEVHSKDFKAQR